MRKLLVGMWKVKSDTGNDHRVVWEPMGGALNSVLGIRPRAQEMGLKDTFSVSRIPLVSETNWKQEGEGGTTSTS